MPIPLRQKVQQELERMEKSGESGPTYALVLWDGGGTKKKQGTLRFCVDLKPLNESVLHEIHPLPKVGDLLAQMSDANFSVNWTQMQVFGKCP